MRTQRNLFVAAMADEACFVHAAPGGNLEQLKARVMEWGIPLVNARDVERGLVR